MTNLTDVKNIIENIEELERSNSCIDESIKFYDSFEYTFETVEGPKKMKYGIVHIPFIAENVMIPLKYLSLVHDANARIIGLLKDTLLKNINSVTEEVNE